MEGVIKMKESLKVHKKNIILLVFIMLAILSILGAVLVTPTYAVKIEDEIICFVEDRDAAQQALEDMEKNIENRLGQDIFLSKDIIIERAYGANIEKVYSINKMKEKIQDKTQVLTKVYALNVDDKDIAYLSNEQEANEILNSLKASYQPREEGKSLQEISFVEKIEVFEKSVPVNKVQKKEKVMELITQGKEVAHSYTLEEGDTVWDIMKEYDLSLEEIEKANPDLNVTKVNIGQELTLMLPEPLIHVKTIEAITYEEGISFETQYQSSKEMYEGDSKVIKEGVEGKKKIYAEIERVNGVKKEEQIIKEETLQEPTKEVIVRGTKERPKTMATGDLATPARGRISSSFGSRWGRMHEGLDIAMPVGTEVKASDGGRITFAGTKGGYGKIVIINHENGYETRYAHNSKLLVNAGDRVYKGEVIAKSGNTGRSTGPHLHFEVRKNGAPVNPRGYINE